MVSFAVVLINAGVLLLGVVTLGYRLGQMKGTLDQLMERVNRLDSRYNGIKRGD